MAEKTDRRVKYTKMVIKQSFLKLLKERPVSKITVKEICDFADVNRGTFYSHYSDAYDLLQQIESELFSEITSSLASPGFSANIHGFLSGIFAIIKKNSELCTVLFCNTGDKDFLNRIINTARERSIAEWFRVNPLASQEKMDMLFTFFASGCVALISEWLENGMKKDEGEMAEFIERISIKGLMAVL